MFSLTDDIQTLVISNNFITKYTFTLLIFTLILLISHEVYKILRKSSLASSSFKIEMISVLFWQQHTVPAGI